MRLRTEISIDWHFRSRRIGSIFVVGDLAWNGNPDNAH
ncbi:hypothetical protein F383_00275 [Gossypium arboreum]|uniref:Uncharacterized protein n=1 Tax=Gossypium arboreum TaxID=29729 RepID=A0A0B0NJ22_GOSAR|nr:hypothetical protein F383_00275 [Gossypium arboreum]